LSFIPAHKNNLPKFSRREFLSLLPFFLVYTVITRLVSDHAFFWDTIQLASKQAHWYFDNNFKYLLLPDSIDSGHIPAFGISLAIFWKVFHKSLLVSHLFMLPFLIGIVYQAYRLITRFFQRKNVYYALILFLIDPTVLSQSMLVSPDILVVFFFLFSLNMILHNKRNLLLFGILALGLISMRGMMIIAVLLLFDLYCNYNDFNGNNLFYKLFGFSLAYIPAGLTVISFLVYHYLNKGWIGYHEDSPWAGCFERVNMRGFIFNIGVLGWRLFDFGRVFLWMLFFVFILRQKKLIGKDNSFKTISILFILTIILLPLIMLFHKNLLGHRYLLPVYLMFSLLVCYQVFELNEKNILKRKLFVFLAIGLITGNLWVYPDRISQGWDSSLAHLPYYNLRNKMIGYINEKGIPLSYIGSEFPNTATFKYTDLSNMDKGFNTKDFSNNPYILYSNIMNDFSDSEINELQTLWIIEKQFGRWPVKVILYRNPKYPL
jgi:hypothetical protein